MNLQHLWRATRARLHRQSGAFDLPSIMIGVAVVAILTVGVLAAIFGVIPWSQDKAAQQDLAAVHTSQGAAFAKDGRFMSKAELAEAKLLPSDVQSVESMEISASDDGRKYVGLSTSKTGREFFISNEAPAPRPLAGDDKWPNGEVIDETAPGAEVPGEDTSAVLSSYSCGGGELRITQAMQDHSDANKQRLADGQKLELFDGGGWAIIIPASQMTGMDEARGVMLSASGVVGDFTSVKNDAGLALVYEMSDLFGQGYFCEAGRTMNQEMVFTDAPVSYMTMSGKTSEKWGSLSSPSRLDGPAVTEWDSNQELVLQQWVVNGIVITDRTDWIEAGGTPSGWDSHSH